jgi:phage terminase large subunit-like protein
VIACIDTDTKNWILDASDDRAARAGCVMDLEAAERVIDWIETHCRLYEGEGAGELIRLLTYQKLFIIRLFGWRRWNKLRKRWVRRFRQASLWAAKKNGKSPFMAALELYVLIGDGEPGQKVYAAAKDGEQARISQRHAVKMVEQSPELSEDCKIYANTLEIQHLPSDSRMTVLSAASSSNRQSKEGLNGSVFWDEYHVVSEELYRRTSRAGISRAEPLDVSVSTAGDDPTCEGKRRFDYGRQVARGERDDLSFLHVEYCCPDEITEEVFAQDPVKHGQQANPAWNEIVDPQEYLDDFNRSRGEPASFSAFLQYRGNLWVSSTARWLDIFGWAEGCRKYTLDDLRGRDCWGGLDLSRTRDMTAFVMVFPWPEDGPECLRLWPMFWLPEKTARKRDRLFPFLTWASRGFLTLTDGSRVDYTRVKNDIREVRQVVNLRGLYYDPALAEELTQSLVEGELAKDGSTIAEGLGCDRTLFEQTITAFTGPSQEWDRLVQDGLIQHPGNAVMSWQVGHVEVKRDVNQNVRPVKPDRWSGKSVDGVVGGIMALRGVLDNRNHQYVY